MEHAATPLQVTPTLGAVAGGPLGPDPGPEVWRAVHFFGASRRLTEITPADTRRWLSGLSGSAERRAHRQALSRFYTRAQELALVPVGYDPASVLQHLGCPGDQIGITDFARTYRRAREADSRA